MAGAFPPPPEEPRPLAGCAALAAAFSRFADARDTTSEKPSSSPPSSASPPSAVSTFSAVSVALSETLGCCLGAFAHFVASAVPSLHCDQTSYKTPYETSDALKRKDKQRANLVRTWHSIHMTKYHRPQKHRKRGTHCALACRAAASASICRLQASYAWSMLMSAPSSPTSCESASPSPASCRSCNSASFSRSCCSSSPGSSTSIFLHATLQKLGQATHH